ncbi:hypothetical protein COU75_01295 [Candidatus Peregrinibacteria bacterium CG10_big_fil_rev_8_21_14_0_10_42_8]|nr:MAG: hypothetical protein COU75_01295 [Candidatus Peregrinibacteria bacterium CG10_big_fil_rev_8_21_14_0_10_42_8]
MLIGAFCLWHIAAIFSYSIYHVEEVPVLQWISDQRSFFRPYVLTTSQWQRWNLFSPDPLRRVIEVDIEQRIHGQWIRVYTLNEHSISWWQRAPELKTMRRMEDDDKEALRERYLLDYCRTRDIPIGTQLRMIKRWHVIPKHEKIYDTEWWQNWQPDWNEHIDVSVTCTAT